MTDAYDNTSFGDEDVPDVYSLFKLPTLKFVCNVQWQRNAACRGSSLDFFHALKSHEQQLQEICDGCPVRMMCLQDAVLNETKDGWWGGYATHKERVEAWTSSAATTE